jgi:hypothetical protein
MFNFNFFNVKTQKIYSAQGKGNSQNTIIQPNQNSVSIKREQKENSSSGNENQIPEISAIKVAIFFSFLILFIAFLYYIFIVNVTSIVTLFIQSIIFGIFHVHTNKNLLTKIQNYNKSIEKQEAAIIKSANDWLKDPSISPTQQLDSYIHERDFIEGVLNQRVTFLVSLFAAFLAALVAFVESSVSSATKDTSHFSLYVPLIALLIVSAFAHWIFYFLCLATYRSYERIRFCIYACDILHRNDKAFNAGTVFKNYENEIKNENGQSNASVLHHIGITIPLLVFYASFVFSLLASAAIALRK